MSGADEMRRGLRNAADRAAKIATCVTAALFAGGGARAIEANFRYGYRARRGALGSAGLHQYHFTLGWTYQFDKVPARIALITE